MIEIFKKLVVQLAIFLTRSKFYPTVIRPMTKPYKVFEVKTYNGYEIEFTFHNETSEYIRHTFGRNSIGVRKYLLISMGFVGIAPEELKRRGDRTFRVAKNPFLMWNEVILSKILLETYLEYITTRKM